MTNADVEKMERQAEAERDEKVRAAHAQYDEAIAHIRWLRKWVNRNGEDATKSKFVVKASRRPKPDGATGRGSLSKAIRIAVRAHAEFTTDGIIKWLDQHYPDVKASGRRISISSKLSRMLKSGALELVDKGEPGHAHVYRQKEGA